MQPQQHDRREWMVHTLGALGFFAASPFSAAGQHVHAVAETQAALSPDWKPAVLSSDENQTLIIVSDAIIPGATLAGCNRAIDLLLTIETPPVREKVRNAIQAFQKELSASDLTTILHRASAPGSSLASPFQTLKQWTSDVYWSSQQGMRELGFKGRVAWATFSGCPHDGVHT